MHEDDPWRHRRLPDNEIPGCVAFEAVLASNDDMVVFVSGMNVFRNGIEFTVEVRVRPGGPSGDLLHDLFDHGSGRDSLLLGIEFADGRRCSTVGTRLPAPATGDMPQLWPDGGGGSDRSASATWFLSPLPPPGGFRIICAWPAWNVTETVTEVPGGPIHEAAGRARELWPWQPAVPAPAPPRPELPEEGWFAEHAGSD